MASNETFSFNDTNSTIPPETDLIDTTFQFNGTETDLPNITIKETPFYLNFRDEPWVIPLVSLSLLNIAAIFIFEIYVLYKSCGGRRHLFLGQVLLLGLFLCSLLGLSYVPQPHWIFCGITRAGIGIAYSIVFGTLLVKCVFLLKLHHGVYFNASFQALFLFFVVLVEIVVIIQWFVYEPPDVVSFASDGKVSVVCQKTPIERIEYLCYVMFLLFLVMVASIRA
ncbi:Metabotropic glutamate receptor 2, partial [Stegodyphus mimosarum]